MKAKCPNCFDNDTRESSGCEACGFTGFVTADVADGDLYSLVCDSCGQESGGCVVGGNSPLKEPPKPTPCVFCSGIRRYIREQGGR